MLRALVQRTSCAATAGAAALVAAGGSDSSAHNSSLLQRLTSLEQRLDSLEHHARETKGWSPFAAHALSASQVKSLEQEGYIVVKALLNDEEVAYLRDSCTNAWREVKGADAKFSGEKTWLQNALLPNVHHHSKAVFEYYFYGPLVDIASQIIGPNLKGTTSQLTFKTKGNTQDFDWHHDNLYGHLRPYNSLSCLTALDKVTEENGCIRLVPKSHLKGQLHPGLTPEEKASHVSVKLDVKEPGLPILMDPGDCLIFHCHCLHRSMGNYTDQDRRILYLRYSDADAVEVYNNGQPRLGRLVRGASRFDEVARYERDLPCPPL